jgi:nucleolar protein 56
MKEGKKGKFQLGVIEPNVGKAIQDSIGVPCVSNDAILELIRGIRHHFTTYVKQLSGGGFEKAQLGLGHSYSRARVKFNVHRADNMIIQSIALLDQLDKDINTNSMRVREWYSWHFPEMGRIVKDNTLYARVAAFIGARSTLTEEGKLEELTKITMDEEVAKEIMEASTMRFVKSRSYSDVGWDVYIYMCVAYITMLTSMLYLFFYSLVQHGNGYIRDRLDQH